MKVKFIKNGYVTEMKDSLAEMYLKKKKVSILEKGKIKEEKEPQNPEPKKKKVSILEKGKIKEEKEPQNPEPIKLDDMTRNQLLALANEKMNLEIPVRSSKDEIITAIKTAEENGNE